MTYKELLSRRLKIILDDIFKGNVSKFGKTIGITEGSIRGYVGDKKENDGSVRIVTPSAEIIALIIEKIGINPEWLISGKGEMLIEDNVDLVNEEKPIYGNNTINIPVEEYNELKKSIRNLIETNRYLSETNRNLSEMGKKKDIADTA